jgi:hypothetical protein
MKRFIKEAEDIVILILPISKESMPKKSLREELEKKKN